MGINRRAFVAATCLVTAAPTLVIAKLREQYKEYNFVDYFDQAKLADRGRIKGLQGDITKATLIAASQPRSNHFDVMKSLSEITERGSTGELFNTRWRDFANPLIVKFFHDIGYSQTPYPGDCTPWCAATVSWCLQRTGLRIPADPASSQSFLNYGQRISDPRLGDICVFTDISDNAHGHVGLFYSQASAETISILGGNQAGESRTNCGPGYRQSKINVSQMSLNPKRSSSVSSHYLSAYIRPNAE